MSNVKTWAKSLSLWLVIGVMTADDVSAQKTYKVIMTTCPPVIDGRISHGEWDGARAESGWQLLRTNPAQPDQHGLEFRALWDKCNLYVLVTSKFDNWSPNNGIFGQSCGGSRVCGPIDFSGNSDNLNFYFDPNLDNEPNDNPPDGYQFVVGTNKGTSSYRRGAITNSWVFQEAHVNAWFGNNGHYAQGSVSSGHTKWCYVGNAGHNGGVFEFAFPWKAFDAPDQEVFHDFAPKAGDSWYVNVAMITSDSANFLPIWNWNPSPVFVTRPDGVWVFSDEVVCFAHTGCAANQNLVGRRRCLRIRRPAGIFCRPRLLHRRSR